MMTRSLWIWMGHTFLVLGFVGVFLPILPTTPFVLVASACYSRGSEKFEAWLLNHRLFGPSIREWRESRVIRPRAKWLASISIAASIIYVVASPRVPIFGKIGMVSVVLPAWAYVLTRPGRM